MTTKTFNIDPYSSPLLADFVVDAIRTGKTVRINGIEVWTAWGLPASCRDNGKFWWDSRDGTHWAETGSHVTVEVE